MEHHEAPSRRPRDASLARASLSPSRAAVIKSTHRSSKNQQTGASQRVPAGQYCLPIRLARSDIRLPSQRPRKSLKPDRSDRSIDRTRSIDRRHRSMGCRMGMCFRQFYHCLMLYNIDIICISQLIKSYFGLRCSHARSMASRRLARRRAASPRDGSTARGDVFIMVRAANANANANARTRERARDVSTAARVGGRRER